MAKPHDLVEVCDKLTKELAVLPGSEKAREIFGDFVEVVERRTRYVNVRASLISPIFAFIFIELSNFLQGRGLNVSALQLLTYALICFVGFVVVEFRNYKLQRLPLRSKVVRILLGWKISRWR